MGNISTTELVIITICAVTIAMWAVRMIKKVFIFIVTAIANKKSNG